MKIFALSYDCDDVGGSGETLRTLTRDLHTRGHTVHLTPVAENADALRSWGPELVIAQQWATQEASQAATALGIPFVMLVHGPGQYEHFMPQCDLVVFNSVELRRAATPAIGRTPAMVVHPPVFRHDYETGSTGEYITFFGPAPHKGIDTFLAVAAALPDEKFLWVTDEASNTMPGNVETVRRRRDVRSIYACTKLLLMPSVYESYGRVAIEAAMSGIPTVASDLPGIREATASLAAFVPAGAAWESAVRAVLADYETYRRQAIALAAMRDPAAELAMLEEQLQRIAASGRRRPTLTLCMTVANEGATLERAIESVAPIVDAIIIGVDQKSTDGTSEIARRLATDYFEYAESSPPDFPRMRNRAMERVETDWVIVIDGHEWIDGVERIRPALETTAWSIEIETLYEPDEHRVPALAFPFPRLHRRHVRFVGAPAHEEVATPMCRRDCRRDIKVWHERKPGAASAARSTEKAGQELDHLRQAWVTKADRRALFYLANGLRDAGRYGDAVEAYLEYLKQPSFPEEGWQAQLYLARCYAATKAWPNARRAFEQAVLAAPERAEASVGLAFVHLECGNAVAATAWFRMAAHLPQPTNCRLFVEVPIYRWGAWHGLAVALAQLGEYAGAAAAEQRALAGGAGEWAKTNIALWLARASAAAPASPTEGIAA